LQQSRDFGQDNVQHTLLEKSQLHWLSFTKKSKSTASPMKIIEKELRKKTTLEIKTKAAIFIPQSKITMSKDTSPKSIKLKTAIQLLKQNFNLKINTTFSTTKGHSKEVTSIQEEEEDEEEERPKDMYCIIHGKGAGHTSKICPKVKKSIEEI
jgi:hypothetical protein